MPESFQDSVESRLKALGGLGAASKFEYARRFIQQGTVPGADKAWARSKAALLRRAPIADAAVQLTKAAYLISKENAREGHAEAGEKLTKKSLPRQVVKTLFDSADSMSKYGAYKEKLDKEAFDKRNKEEISKYSSPYGKRNDGTNKGTGYLGELKLPDGSVATEYTTQSNAVTVNGERIDFPTLVPTLSKQEISLMQNDLIPNKKEIPEPIMRKAIDHANMRLQKGLSVFK
jgi:hypothetical protein